MWQKSQLFHTYQILHYYLCFLGLSSFSYGHFDWSLWSSKGLYMFTYWSGIENIKVNDWILNKSEAQFHKHLKWKSIAFRKLSNSLFNVFTFLILIPDSAKARISLAQYRKQTAFFFLRDIAVKDRAAHGTVPFFSTKAGGLRWQACTNLQLAHFRKMEGDEIYTTDIPREEYLPMQKQQNKNLLRVYIYIYKSTS